MHSKTKEFLEEKKKNIEELGNQSNLKELGLSFLVETHPSKYSYNFTWLGIPIIQFPQDIVALQEIIWEVKPDLIIETGIAHGGSLILSASILELIGGEGSVVGIDIDIRPHNREAIESHQLFKRIELIEGSSISEEVVEKVRDIAQNKKSVLVILDSNHTHDHVLSELQMYSPLVTVGSYCIVFDTVIEDIPEELFHERPWSRGNNSKTAVWEFMRENKDFEIDKTIEDKLLITVAPDGFLKRTK
jgi:cephalosporin hydroxylase